MASDKEQAVGRAVTCTVCDRTKAPSGRSVPMEMFMCDHDCEGYMLSPHPGDLWPGETAEEFGYPCSGPWEDKDD